MKAKQVWAVVPFSRPQWLENVKSNFYSQNFHNKKLAIVENGSAIGYCRSVGFEPDLLLTSDNHQAIAKATALDELKRIGVDYWTTWDDDDFYGEDYITELASVSDKADIIGKMSIFVKSIEDDFRLFGCPIENSNTDFVHGPTISGWVSDAVQFPNVGKWAEDCAFINDMKEKGATVYSSSRWNFIYQRHKSNNHTWIITSDQMCQGWFYTVDDSYILQYVCDPDIAKQFASRKINHLKNFEVKKKPYKIEDCAAYTYERKNAGSMKDWIKSAAKELGLDKKLQID